MTANSIDPPPDVLLVTLLTFTWGTSSAAYYCSDTNPITIGGNTFLAEPSIVVTMQQLQGGAQDVPIKVQMVVKPPLDLLTTEASHAPVQIKIEEVNPADFTSKRSLYSGTIRVSTRNIENKSGIVEAQVSGWRFPLEVSANAFQANIGCNNTFGDEICKANLTMLRENGTISSVDGTVVTLTGLTTIATAGYWRAGYLTYDGLSIQVRAYTTGSNLTLLKAPPSAWQGKTVVATPGCDKLLPTCRRFGREESFTGFGIAVPSYNPYFESPK